MQSEDQSPKSEELTMEQSNADKSIQPNTQAGAKSQTTPESSDPPDGGLQAWLQVLSSFLILFNVLGLLNTYGQFQTLYETDILKHESSSTITWIGSAQMFICYGTCIFTGPIWDSGRLYFLLGTGTVVMVFGIMMTSLCIEFYQFFLAQAVVTGVGFGFVFMPASAITPMWFSKKTSFAVGVTMTGSSIGAVIYPIVLKQLEPKIGFPWTIRMIGFMVLATMALASYLMKMRGQAPEVKRKLIDLQHFKHMPFLLSCLGFFIGFLGLYVFYYYIELYASDVAGTTSDLAFYLLAILNAGSFFGRLLPNYLAGIIGPMNVQILFGTVSAILSFCLLVIKTTPGVVAFTAIYGFVSGPYVSLTIPVVASVTDNRNVLGTRLGMSFVFVGLGVLVGEPAAGAILGASENWTGLIIWCGVMLLGSSVVLFAARWFKIGPVLLGKA